LPRVDPAKLTKVSLSLPFGLGSAEWESDPTERKAAWELYVELVTRISVEPLAAEDGVLREALTSLYNLFPTTRDVLRRAGPDVGASPKYVGGIAIAVLNRGLRPFLAKWHPRLQAWEAQRPANLSPQEHEKAWPDEIQVRHELEALRQELKKYSEALAKIAGVESTG